MGHLSLFELNTLIKQKLETSLDPSYWVVAEIGSLSVNQKGHCYMELVEKEGNFISAKIRANIWSYTYRTISGYFESVTSTQLKAGMKVLFNVTVLYHEVYGISLNIKEIDPNYTLGERARKRQQIIEKLQANGVFGLNKLLILPLVPQRIAIISSETAAGYGDFMDQLGSNQRNFRFDCRLFQSLMQGEEAPSSILKSLEQIKSNYQDFDIVVVIRGGGAQTDLDCFDDYNLASCVAQFPLPVVTGIGHERDETIVDMVAHTKMKTPTAVADFLIKGLESLDDSLDQFFYRIYQNASAEIKNHTHILTQMSSLLNLNSINRIKESKMDLNRLFDHLIIRSEAKIRYNETKILDIERSLRNKITAYFNDQNQRLSNFDKGLKLVEPESVLKRGYTISRVNGVLLSDTKVEDGQELITTFKNGEIKSTIKTEG